MTRSNQRKGFTLIELIATIVILAIILAITVPVITGVVGNATKASFESDAKMVIKAIDYKKLSAAEFDPTTINKSNLTEELGLSDENYASVNFTIEENVLIVSIIGKDKWNGLIACGTFKNMKVVENASQCEGDSIPPVLTVLGENPVNIYIGETYIDAGATATDNLVGDITDKIIITGTVNPNLPGKYTIIYTVKDLFDNETTSSRTVNVIDNAFPIIDFNPNGNSVYAKSRTTTIDVRDLGLIDNESPKYIWTLSDTEPQPNEFNTSFNNNQSITTPAGVSGSYYLWATASDTAGNVTTTRSNIFNLDNEKPVITINGNSSVTINKGSSYSDAGAAVTDNIDTSVAVTTTGSVNPNIVGTYTITYNATDSSGNQATPVTRTINVIDVKAPVITITGSNPVTINVGSAYSDAGATALDDVDGDVTGKIITTSNVNTNSLGTYTVTYTVTDIAGNKATATRTVNVVDTTKPTIAFGTNGNSTYAKSRSTTVTVSDNVTINTSSLKYLWNTSTTTPSEASITTSFTNGGTISTPAGVTGDYYLWILAKDTSGNTTIIRSNVFKLDNTKPVITITGSNPVTVSGGGSYSDAGATATDDHSGLNGSITTTSTVNTNALGTYTVSDKAGNTATATRTVKVVDNILPTVTTATVPTTWTSGNKIITVTGTDTGLSGIAGYYIGASSTKPTAGSTWTASTSTTWTVSRGAGTYYIWIKDGAGNISSTYKSVTVTNIDANAPTVTAKGSSYTIIEGASNVISSTYFTISANGSAPISSTTCIDTSKSNATVTNTSTLATGTHVIKCTVTKATGLSSNAQTTIVVNPAYTGLPNVTYTRNQIIDYAGLQWRVYREEGDEVYLLLYGDLGNLGFADLTEARNYLLNTWIPSNKVMNVDYQTGYLTGYGIPSATWFKPCPYGGCSGPSPISTKYTSDNDKVYFYTSTIASSNKDGNCSYSKGQYQTMASNGDYFNSYGCYTWTTYIRYYATRPYIRVKKIP